MARAGISIDETIPAVGVGAGVALDQLLAAVSVDGEYQAVAVAPDRLQFARTYRPTWALVCGWITIWAALIGVLFFFVKTTETCLAVVESDHRGTRIRLSGRLSSAAIGRVRTALTGEQAVATPQAPVMGGPIGAPTDVVAPGYQVAAAASPVVPPPAPSLLPPPARPAAQQPEPPSTPAFTPMPTHAQSPDPGRVPSRPSMFVPEPEISLPAPPSTPAPAVVPLGAPSPLRPTIPQQLATDESKTIVVASRQAAAPALVLPDGRRIDLTERALLGRDPAASGPGALGVQLITVPDSTRSVSKTHAEVVRHGGSWWVLDRHSTNGVQLDDGNGGVLRLEPGVPMQVDANTTIFLGEQPVTLSLGQS